MSKRLKIAFIAQLPASSILPMQFIKKRVQHLAMQKHPAPWVQNLALELKKIKNVEIEVFSHSRSVHKTYKAKINGVGYNFVPKYEPVRSDPYHLYLPARFQVLPLVRHYNPDVVHGFGTEGANSLLAVSAGKPCVVFIQGIQEKLAPYYTMHRLKVMIRKKLERYVISKADALIAETDFAARWAKTIRYTNGIKIIPHAVTDKFFHAKPKFQTKKILCIGALSNTKGTSVVLKAFILGKINEPKLFNGAKLVFIGKGPLEKALKKEVKNNGLTESVIFRGQIHHGSIFNEIEKARMLVIGSRMDTSPNVITEAHAAGIPVIGTAAGGIPDMIEDGKDGYIVPVDDSQMMSEKMAYLLKYIKRCVNMGHRSHFKT
jgi:glycosyltransferase involved in cell wall biosynthesis